MLQADSGNNLLRLVNLTTGTVTTLAGNPATAPYPGNYGHADGAGTVASFFYPYAVAMDSAGTFAIVVCLMSEFGSF